MGCGCLGFRKKARGGGRKGMVDRHGVMDGRLGCVKQKAFVRFMALRLRMGNREFMSGT